MKTLSIIFVNKHEGGNKVKNSYWLRSFMMSKNQNGPHIL